MACHISSGIRTVMGAGRPAYSAAADAKPYESRTTATPARRGNGLSLKMRSSMDAIGDALDAHLEAPGHQAAHEGRRRRPRPPRARVREGAGSRRARRHRDDAQRLCEGRPRLAGAGRREAGCLPRRVKSNPLSSPGAGTASRDHPRRLQGLTAEARRVSRHEKIEREYPLLTNPMQQRSSAHSQERWPNA
jgi:hypothetical protein